MPMGKLGFKWISDEYCSLLCRKGNAHSEKYYKAICKYVNVTVIIANLEVIEPRLNSSKFFFVFYQENHYQRIVCNASLIL